MSKLLIDDREGAVYKNHAVEFKGVSHEVMRITSGDYMVVRDGVVLAIIERKSLSDFASSIRDGRSENIRKLIDFRAKTNCRIIFLIEGKLNPKQNDTFSNFTYKSIESAIFHLIIRDNVCVLRTADALDTAQQLVRFVASMDTLKSTELEPLINGGIDNNTENKIAEESLLAMIKQKHVRTDQEICRDLWNCFRSISVESADSFINTWSIADIVLGRISREVISAHKMNTGRAINKNAATSLMGVDKLTETRLLSHIPGISAKSANFILAKMPLVDLLAKTQAELQEINATEKKKINKTTAENIIKYFNFIEVK